MQHAARRGYQLVHRSRPVRTEDFYNFDLIIGMDDRNIDDLKEKAPSTEEWKKIHRMTEYCTRIPADLSPTPTMEGPKDLNMCWMYSKTLVPVCLLL